jgi:glyoxylase-like metal-dependent hydrolase (beta-lactamase superfamily II)
MKVAENVYLLGSTKGAYAYLVTGEETVLIDTGFSWQGKALLKELASMRIDPHSIRHILLTHSDLDHIGNAAMLQRLTGAKLWASQKDKPFILGEKPRPGFKKWLPYIFRVEKPAHISVFEAGQKIGGVETVPAPGHTAGHVCMLYGGVLFAGDLVKNDKGRIIPYPKGWNWDNAMLLDSVRKINELRFDCVCPAHGKPMHTKILPG